MHPTYLLFVVLLITVAHCFHKPVYHFSAPHGTWINDPVGTIYFKGLYHLYYQFNPKSTSWGAPYWAHVYSHDLIHWKSLPNALEPSYPYETAGCWSGSAFKFPHDHDDVYFWYTAAQPQTQCLAVSNDSLLQYFHRSSSNPILPFSAKPSQFNDAFRDPQIFLAPDNSLVMILGTGIKETKKGAVIRYRSRDYNKSAGVYDWQYDGIVIKDEGQFPFDLLSTWECPVVFKLPNTHDTFGLLISVEHDNPNTSYIIMGAMSDQDFDFVPSQSFLFDPGVYATRNFVMDSDDVILIGWVREFRENSEDFSGLFTLPRAVTLCKSSSMYVVYRESKLFDSFCYAVPESVTSTLRSNHQSIQIDKGHHQVIKTCENKCELSVEISNFKKFTQERIMISLFTSPDYRERTLLKFDFKTGAMSLVLTHSSFSPNVSKDTVTVPLLFSSQQMNELSLSIFVDNSIVEIIANGRSLLTARVYPSMKQSNLISLYSDSVDMKVDLYHYKKVF
ncbi:hypothetical protein GEMRC1_008219 [Eukaryota sp. GEM-RC1]